MTAYVDASVILRVVLGQHGRLREWRSIRRLLASTLVQVECLRTLDRLRLSGSMADEEIAVRREAVFGVVGEMTLVEVTTPILLRAAQLLPVALGTLDAIHLATALAWQERESVALVMATHDDALALAARASGLRAVGV